jgi:hypothetical protein
VDSLHGFIHRGQEQTKELMHEGTDPFVGVVARAECLVHRYRDDLFGVQQADASSSFLALERRAR